MLSRLATLPLANLDSLGHCRVFEGWEMAGEGEVVWVKAPGLLPEEEQRMWRVLPFLERFEERKDGLLCREGEQVPCRKKPALDWLPLPEGLCLSPPTFLLPGGVPSPVAMIPMRVATAPLEPALVLLTARAWQDWALTAPLPRLQPLRFAVSEDGRVCVGGTPLPPLPGAYYVAAGEGIALAAGWAFPSQAKPRWLAEACSLRKDDVALWHPDGSIEILSAALWAEASRANVRAACDPYWRRKERL